MGPTLGREDLTAELRLLLVGDSHSHVSKLLIEAAVRAARQRPDVRVVAICDAARFPPPGARRAVRRALAAVGKRLFDRGHPVVLHRPMFESLRAVAARLAVPLVVPPGRDLNSPAFAALVRDELRIDGALSLICLQIFGPALLSRFRAVVNYHNGLLPEYRGVRTTSWSVYHGEAETGFTFHRMTAAIDEGPILLSGAVPVTSGPSVSQLEWRKSVLAASRLGEVLEMLVADAPGRPQAGSGRYFSRRARRPLLSVADPSALDWDELARRLRAFEMLTLRLDDRELPVTRLRRLDGRRPHRAGFAFATSDGVTTEPDRFVHLPYAIYRLYRPLRGRARHDA